MPIDKRILDEVALDGNGRYCFLGPFIGTAMAEAARNLVGAGLAR